MNVVPFRREHLQRMVLQPRQEGMRELLTDELYAMMESSDSFTGLDGDRVLACAGTFQIWQGRAAAWAYISNDVGNRMLDVTRAVRRYLDMVGHRRVEMDVDVEFEAAHRWARLLGFTLEAPHREFFTPDGRDCALYARVRK